MQPLFGLTRNKMEDINVKLKKKIPWKFILKKRVSD